ncbi:MAG: zinc-dependent alcohol dehydrogenase [Christensenellales bacterium]|jgi:threonine dehydrogenase-like Zn-dependent dehydrogenase
MSEMKAVIFKETGKYEVTTRPIPKITKADEVLLKIEAASICGTDVHILHDPPGAPATIGAILGHELVGEVIEVGSGVSSLKVGDRVVCDPNVPCGNCHMCRTGSPNVCENVETVGIDVDGGFAQYGIVPERALQIIPQDLDVDTAVFAEPVNCVMGAMNKIRLLPGENALVMGAGPIGLYFTALLKANGASKVLVSEVSDFRSPYALTMGADRVINPKTENLEEEVKKETNGRGVDVVIDAVGVLLPDCLKCVRRAGKILLFGQNYAVQQTLYQNDITRNGLTLYGNYVGLFTMPTTIELLASGIIDFQKIITHRITLDEFGVGMQAMNEGKGLEVVIYPNK